MSETSMLISCTGKITRAELAELPTLPATTTHIPIPPAAVVKTLVENLESRSHWRLRRGVRSVHGRHGECSASSIWRQALTATVSRSELETRIPYLQPKDDAASAAASAAPLTRASNIGVPPQLSFTRISNSGSQGK